MWVTNTLRLTLRSVVETTARWQQVNLHENSYVRDTNEGWVTVMSQFKSKKNRNASCRMGLQHVADWHIVGWKQNVSFGKIFVTSDVKQKCITSTTIVEPTYSPFASDQWLGNLTMQGKLNNRWICADPLLPVIAYTPQWTKAFDTWSSFFLNLCSLTFVFVCGFVYVWVRACHCFQMWQIRVSAWGHTGIPKTAAIAKAGFVKFASACFGWVYQASSDQFTQKTARNAPK